MAHTKSAKKRIVTAAKSRLRNQSVKSRVKTTIKKFEAALVTKEADTAKTALSLVFTEIDKAVSKGIIHKNAAARKKAGLSIKLNKLVSA